MAFNIDATHECSVEEQPFADQWDCPECGQVWLLDWPMSCWEFPEIREARIAAAGADAGPPPPELMAEGAVYDGG